MSKLKICIIDLASKAPTRSLYARVMHANLASIMPQVVAIWCEAAGHDVTFVCFTGLEDLQKELPSDSDLVFVSAFSQSAQLAYALSNFYRSQGARTVLGGPHARCYPQDAQKYFDYVVGFTNQETIGEILRDGAPHRPVGRYLNAARNPEFLPGVRERWKYIEPTLRKAPLLKIVPMVGSLGCPYTCSFCIDATTPYQPLSFETLREDLKFLRTKLKRPRVGWHDPNFGVRFNEYMDAIEAAAPPDSIDFIAESSLSLLSEPHLERLKRNGFKAILPGIESWYELGNKSKTGARNGMEKVKQVSEHVNLIMEYIPYVQTNFVLGMDSESGDEPFELTKRFLDLTPGAFPGYSLLSAFGQAAKLNLEYQREGRVLAFPHHFLDNNQAMNVKPRNYSWIEFYEHVIGLTGYSFSLKATAKRFRANSKAGPIPQWMNVVRSISAEGWGRMRYHADIRRRFDTDPEFLPFFNLESDRLPRFYQARVQKELGPLWEWLPRGALFHDPNAYLKAEEGEAIPTIQVGAAR